MANKDSREQKRDATESARNTALIKTALTWTLTASAVCLVIGGLAAFAVFGYARLYENRIFPGVRILNVRLDGLTAEEARTAVHTAIDQALKDGLRFTFEGREVTLDASTVPTTDMDASRDLIRYDITGAILAATGYGRSNSLLRDTIARWRARIKPVHLDAGIFLDENGIADALQSTVALQLNPVKNADLSVTWNDTTKSAEIEIIPSAEGRELHTDAALRELREQAKSLNFFPITLTDRRAEPTIHTEDVQRLVPDVQTVLNHAPFTLTFENERFEVGKQTLASWIGVVSDENGMNVSIDPEKFATGIRALADIETTAMPGSLVLRDGKVESFKAGTEGIAIVDGETLKGIREHWNASSTFPIITIRQEPALAGADPERLGIKEIVGIGTSNFSGSPSNRRKNIALGVSRVNGSLIGPGEEFSLLKTLGATFTAAQGWLPELVIKGNETKPEYGGGLCQIGTTTFRAALNAGMKITQRQNHSYRVRYYEPAGTDATIYEGAPDFRFVNDTKNSIYIHAYISGDDVMYEFWGTDDGRKVTVGPPRIFNITAPPPKKLVETTDLAPGKVVCTESAHAGADAELPYRIEYADGRVHEEVFRSHYRPWQAVCLVGVEKLTEDASAGGTTGGTSAVPDGNAAEATGDTSGDLSAIVP